jgi:enoyl-CoA hydratase/carnithine racemase
VSYETILYEVAEHVGTITLNRPDKRNAFNRVMCDEFEDLWQRIRFDEDVRVVVLRAAGDKAFCAGLDISAGFSPPAEPFSRADPGRQLCPKQAEVWKPVIAAIHGVAAGGAFYWINECDLVVCSEDAVFFDPHTSIGLVTSLTAIGMIHHGVALREAMRVALLGLDERLSAATAREIGLVNEVVPRDELWPRAHELALQIAAKPPAAVQGSVKAIWSTLDMAWPEARRFGLAHSQIGNPLAAEQLAAEPRTDRSWRLR